MKTEGIILARRGNIRVVLTPDLGEVDVVGLPYPPLFRVKMLLREEKRWRALWSNPLEFFDLRNKPKGWMVAQCVAMAVMDLDLGPSRSLYRLVLNALRRLPDEDPGRVARDFVSGVLRELGEEAGEDPFLALEMKTGVIWCRKRAERS